MKRTVLWICLAIGLCLVLLVAWLSTQGADPLRSDPAKPRDFAREDYDQALHVAAGKLSLDTNILQGFQVIQTPSELDVAYPGSLRMTNKWPWAVQTHQLSSSSSHSLPEGAVYLEYIGVAYGPLTNPAVTLSENLPGKFFYPDGRPLPAVEEKRLKLGPWEKSIQSMGRGVSISFGIHMPERDAKFMNPKLYDARTHMRIADAHSYGMLGPGRYRVTVEASLWHAAPIELAFDIAHGPIQEFLFPAQAGAGVSFPGGVIKLVGCAPGYASSSSIGGGVGGTAMTARAMLDPSRTNNSTLVFAYAPSAGPVPIEVEIVDDHGKVLPRLGGMSSEFIEIAGVSGPLESFRQVRVRYYSSVDRYFFRFQEIPGLPEPSGPVQNLFDVNIPYLYVQSVDQLLDDAARAAQVHLGARTVSATVAPGYFPRGYTNVTPRQLIREYSRFCPYDVRLVTDPESEELIFRRAAYGRFLEKIRQWLK